MKHEKQLLLSEIHDQMKGVNSYIIAGYKNLTANRANGFRREIAKVGGNFEVIKKRLFVKILEQEGIKFDLMTLPGHIGLIFATKDPLELVKATCKFSKDNEEAFLLLGAKVEGEMLNGKDVEILSTLPSKDQMRAQLLGLFEAPMAQVLSVIEASLSSVVYCLDNKVAQAEGKQDK
jgi:large subunit ribosomal protein L10